MIKPPAIIRTIAADAKHNETKSLRFHCFPADLPNYMGVKQITDDVI